MAKVWWNPLAAEQIILRSPLSPEECIERIRANTYVLWRGGDPTLPFIGEVKGHRFMIFKDKILARRNSTHLVAEGEIHADAVNGTTIRILLSMRDSFGLPMFLAAYVILVIVVIHYVAIMLGVDPTWSTPLTVLASVVLGIGGVYAICLLAAWGIQGEKGFLITTLQKLLSASVLSP